jgi:hypothetical protein
MYTDNGIKKINFSTKIIRIRIVQFFKIIVNLIISTNFDFSGASVIRCSLILNKSTNAFVQQSKMDTSQIF